MIIFKEFTFDSAHRLIKVPVGHKCKAIHGHTYHLKIVIEGEVDEEMGWVMDFTDMKKVLNPIIESVDHKYLNDIQGLENPTCEIMAQWFSNRIKPGIPLLKQIELKETPTSGAICTGN